MAAMASVQFDTDDEELIRFLRRVAAEYADPKQNRIGHGTGARIILEKFKDHPDLLAQLFSGELKAQTNGEHDSDAGEVPKAASQRRRR